MDPLLILLTVVITILTILLVIVGVQVILILREVRSSMLRVNRSLDKVDQLLSKANAPFAHMGGFMGGVKSGLKLTESFIHWLKKNPHSNEHDVR